MPTTRTEIQDSRASKLVHAIPYSGRNVPVLWAHPLLRFTVVFLWCILSTCSPKPFEDPLAVMTDREAGYNQRRVASAQVRQQMPDDPQRVKALQTILWEPRYPTWQRNDAVDQLVELNEAAFREALPRRFGRLKDWETIEHIFGYAVDREWTDLTPVAVRNYARPAIRIADSDRPERQVIAKLNPGKTVEQVIFEVFAHSDDRVSFLEQVAAWELLVRRSDPWTLMSQLHRAPAGTPLVIDLKAAADQLHVLPPHREAVLWLQHLRAPAQSAFWQAAAACVAELSSPQCRGLQLRHLPSLLAASAADRRKPLAQLDQDIDRATRSGQRHLTGPRYDGPLDDWPQRFTHWRPKLCWGDLLTIELLCRAMRQRNLVRRLFAQADQDRGDVSTEYGGVLVHEDGSFTARRYEPLYRDHDLKFIPSAQMIERLYTSIAHYHFHAQRTKNVRYAGPGEGDLRLADRLGASCVVFTFIDDDRLNVDYYQPGRVVVDLGTIFRHP